MRFFYYRNMNIQDLYPIFLKSSGVTTDTRNAIENSIFFALKGETFNGNKFARQALENRCAFAVIDEKEYALDDRYILVTNVLETLQELAGYHRNNLRIPVIAITGTNGKTTTKELIAAVLSKKYKVAFTQGNLNNHIGVPLTLLSINRTHEMAIIEMGANHPGEIKILAEIAKPDFGIITNIGKAHLEGFGSFENVIKTKTELYHYLKTQNGKVFYNRDNEILDEYVQRLELDSISYGRKSNHLYGELLSSEKFLEADIFVDGLIKRICTNLVGGYNLENVLAAISIGKYFKVDLEYLISAIEDYKPKNNRSQFVDTDKNSLILDAYNANPTSVDAALRNFESLHLDHKCVILGDMKELGSESLVEHEKIIKYLENTNFDIKVLIGEIYSSLKTATDILRFKDVNEFNGWLSENPIINSTILIKGSRAVKLEEIVKNL